MSFPRITRFDPCREFSRAGHFFILARRGCLAFFFALGVVFFPRLAAAETPPGLTKPESNPPAISSSPTAATPGEADFSFDLLDKKNPATGGDAQAVGKANVLADPLAGPAAKAEALAAIERKTKIRRAMLKTHLAVGVATMATMAATLVIGQLDYMDQYVNGEFSGRYSGPHLGLGITAATLFATNAGLALFSPDPYKKKYRFDTVMVHRIAQGLAAAGMATQLVLGFVTVSREGCLDQKDWAMAHLVTGYATYACMATGTVVNLF